MLKRLADDLVSKGHDIPDVRSLFEALTKKETTIKLFYVEEEDVEKVVQAISQNIPLVPSMMRLHQVVTLARDNLICRDISCMCAPMKRLNCECYSSQVFTFHLDQTPTQPSAVDWTNSEVIGKWCVVRYDDDIFPGIVMATDESYAQVKCMHRIGENRFFWPAREDALWYLHDDVIRFIPAPLPVTARHMEIQRDIWLDLLQ